MEDCVFCGIAAGTMPARIVWEDEDFVAFDDIHPQAPVHALVIPRRHYRSLADDVSESLLGRMCLAVTKTAEVKGVAGSGYRVIVNTGRDAGQSVDHLHVHILGGARMSHGMVNLVEKPEE